MKIIERKISELIFANYNSRKISDKQLADLKDSIEKFGIQEPAIININTERKNIIISGHQRIKVCETLHIDKMPCVEINLSLEKEKELNIRMNRNTGEFDFELLEKYFKEEDLIEWGFEDNEFINIDVINEMNVWNELDMPKFENAEKDFKIIIVFETEKKRSSFVKEKNINITKKICNQWISKV